MKLRILKRTILRSAKKANAVIALSETCRRILISYGICSESITVIPNGVDQVTSLRNKDTTSEHEGAASYILCVSHFYRYKNFETLIKSYKILRESIVCIHNLKIVGRFEDKTYLSELRSLIQKLDIESHVELIPEVNHSDLNVLYRNAELFIFPSIVENSPNVLIEAMSHGLPIISSNRNPMPEFGGNAISYFESHDEIELAFKMKNILLDDDLSRKFSLLALERSRHFSWEKFTLDVVTLCSYVVGNNVERDSTQKL
jgi:glycosyltransferase involved in cell wall biosynthesis